jgi:hypothetical protein
VPKPDFRQIRDLYQAVGDHERLICMGSSLLPGNPLQSTADLAEFCGLLRDLGRPFQLAIHQNMVKQASEQELEDHVRQLLQTAKGGNCMIRTDVLDPKMPPGRVDALVRVIEKYGQG